MKAWKRLLIALLAVLMLCSLVACDDEPPAEEPAPDDGGTTPQAEEKAIDVYFIAGQSNAAGTTTIEDAAALIADYPALSTGTDPYIMYAGVSAALDDKAPANHNWGSVKLGLGYNATHFGPEVGMAKELSAYYNAETGKQAAIIKYTHGGTGLRNEWKPPSSRSENEAEGIGGLYDGLVNEAYKRLSELKEKGYNKINIKGLYWMQGCNDTWVYSDNPLSYPALFANLVNDFRNDLKEIMRDLQGEYAGAHNIPFFIGTISPTYRMGEGSKGKTWTDNGQAMTTAQNRNNPFIEMQKKLAEDNRNCYIIDNGAYQTVKYEVAANGTVTYTVIGRDVSHWGQADCYAVGRNVGKMLLEKCTDYRP